MADDRLICTMRRYQPPGSVEFGTDTIHGKPRDHLRVTILASRPDQISVLPGLLPARRAVNMSTKVSFAS